MDAQMPASEIRRVDAAELIPKPIAAEADVPWPDFTPITTHVALEVVRYRGWNTPAGDLMAATLVELLGRMRVTNATTFGEITDRETAMDAQRLGDAFDRGHEAGCRA